MRDVRGTQWAWDICLEKTEAEKQSYISYDGRFGYEGKTF